MVELTKEQREEIKAIMAAKAKREHDALIDYLEAGGYEIDDTLEILADEVYEYAQNKGYGYCDSCDERRGDPSDRCP